MQPSQQPRGHPHSAQVKTGPSLVTCPGSPSKDVNEPGLPLRSRSQDDARVLGSILLPPQVPDGFISHFYSVSEHVSPVLAFGFLGPKPQLAEVCAFFKVSRVLRPLLLPGPACPGPWDWSPGGFQECREGWACSSRKPGGTRRACRPFHWEPGPVGLRKPWDQNPRTRDSVGVPEVKGRALGGLEAIRGGQGLGPRSHDSSVPQHQIVQYLRDMFDLDNVRYTSVPALADDILQLSRRRSEILLGYLGAPVASSVGLNGVLPRENGPPEEL